MATAYILVPGISIVNGTNGTGVDLGGGGGGGGLSKGAIAGIVVGSVVGALLLLLCLCGLCFLLGLCGAGFLRRDSDISEPSSAEASRKRDERVSGMPVMVPVVAGAGLGGAGALGAATTAPDLSGEESVYRSYHTPPPAEVSEVDPDQSSQLHIHV